MQYLREVRVPSIMMLDHPFMPAQTILVIFKMEPSMDMHLETIQKTFIVTYNRIYMLVIFKMEPSHGYASRNNSENVPSYI